MLKISFVLFLSVFFLFPKGFAQDQKVRLWSKVSVPGAVCGDGGAYHFFVSKGSRSKIAFDFMGGGACWSAETCYGDQKKTIMSAVPAPIEIDGFVSANPLISPIADHTFVYFPYCTGDVHLGKHTAQYGTKQVHHNGFENIRRSLALLAAQQLDPRIVTDVVVYGYSAGAIGALVHQKTIQQYFPYASKKTLISDSPGLHFGPNFWKKFTPELVADYAFAMAGVGLTLNPNDGFVARKIDQLCRQQADWKIGFLQSTRDLVMSKVFGEITQDEHQSLVLGDEGLLAKTRGGFGNCSAWIPHNEMHTYLISTAVAVGTSADGMSALEYFNRLIGN